MGASEFEEAWAAESSDQVRRQADAQHVGHAILRERCRGLGVHEAITVGPTATIREAIAVMVEKSVGCVLVLDGEKLVGIFTERDVMTRIVYKGIAQDRPISDVMTHDPLVLGVDDPIVFLLNRMVDGGYRHVPIVDGQGGPLGVLSVRSFVEWVVGYVRREVLNLPPRTRESYPPRIDGG